MIGFNAIGNISAILDEIKGTGWATGKDDLFSINKGIEYSSAFLYIMTCKVGMTPSPSSIWFVEEPPTNYVWYNDIFNNHWYAVIADDFNAHGAGITGEARMILDYQHPVMAIITEPFSGDVEEYDRIMLIHESIYNPRTSQYNAIHTTTNAAYETVLDVTRKGILYNVLFQQQSGGIGTIEVTLDGTVYEFTATLAQSYCVMVWRDQYHVTESFEGLPLSDADYIRQPLDVWFNKSLKIRHKTDSGNNYLCRVNYGI